MLMGSSIFIPLQQGLRQSVSVREHSWTSFYLYSITTRIKTNTSTYNKKEFESSIFIPLQQGLRLVDFYVKFESFWSSIFIPLQQGLRRLI